MGPPLRQGTPPPLSAEMLAPLKAPCPPPGLPLPTDDPIFSINRIMQQIEPLQDRAEYERRAEEAAEFAAAQAASNARRKEEMEEARQVHEDLSARLPDRNKRVPQRAPGMPPPRRELTGRPLVMRDMSPRVATSSYKSFPPPTPPLGHRLRAVPPSASRHVDLRLGGEAARLDQRPITPRSMSAATQQLAPPSPRLLPVAPSASPVGLRRPDPPAPTPQPIVPLSPLPPHTGADFEDRRPSLPPAHADLSPAPARAVGGMGATVATRDLAAPSVLRPAAHPPPSHGPPPVRPPIWRHAEAKSAHAPAAPRAWRPSGGAAIPAPRPAPGGQSSRHPTASLAPEDADDMLRLMVELPPIEGHSALSSSALSPKGGASGRARPAGVPAPGPPVDRGDGEQSYANAPSAPPISPTGDGSDPPAAAAALAPAAAVDGVDHEEELVAATAYRPGASPPPPTAADGTRPPPAAAPLAAPGAELCVAVIPPSGMRVTSFGTRVPGVT